MSRKTKIVRTVLAVALAALAAFSSSQFSAQDTAVDASALSARNVVELRKHVGQEVVIEGKIGRTNTSSSGNHFLNFAASEFTAVCFKDDVAKFDSGGPAKLFDGKTVQVSGKLETYKGKLQLKLTSPKQISIIDGVQESVDHNESSVANEDEPIGVGQVTYLKQIGDTHWLSPAGLEYRGRDPQGLNRVEHVLRHAQDIPDRDGSHGVFTGGVDRVFQTIDEAWKLAEKKRLKPDVQGNRSTLTVSMGRKVGYLGGRNGRQRRNPELRKIFIVFETDTKNIVTAFPK
ncbi:MAG: hypothetical protein KDA87_05475 [Planctomycetales bacterium]|nr:hypothetical protein [Planctomycetales bacterium]